MELVNKLLEYLVIFLDKVLPILNLPDSFYTTLDTGMSSFIELLRMGAYFIPLDILVLCISVMLIVDNFALLTRIGQFLIKLIRG
jgi:hypothetical protein